MIEHQEYFGRKFYQDKKTGYWISTDYPRIRAHRWVWEQIHGKIPKGYHIHHKNENKSDNRIENLELIERSRHIKHHFTNEKREKARLWANQIRPLTKKWHASEEGKLWHRLHGIKCWDKREYKTIVCKQCGNQTTTKTYHQEFCSNKCKSKWRRYEGRDNIEKFCEVCQKPFIVNKYDKSLCCSRSCAAKLRWISKRKK